MVPGFLRGLPDLRFFASRAADCHPERKSRDPVAELQGNIAGSFDYVRDDRLKKLRFAGTALDTTDHFCA